MLNSRAVGVRGALALIAMLLVFAGQPVAQPVALAQTPVIGGTVNFDREDRFEQLSPGSDKAAFPWAAIDQNGFSHVVWSQDDGMYFRNGITGGITQLSRSSSIDREPVTALRSGPNNTLHLVYSKNRDSTPRIYYRQATIAGNQVNWGTEELVGGSIKALGPTSAVDKAGNVHIVWIDQVGGNVYNAFYRVRFANGNYSDTSRPLPTASAASGQNRPQVAVTAEGAVHMSFTNGRDIFHGRLTANGWVTQNISRSGSTNSANASIAAFGNGVYIAWGEGIASGNHDIQFRASFDGGLTFSDRVDISNSPQFAQNPNLFFVEATNRVYMVWNDDTGSTDGRAEVYFREFDPISRSFGFADRITRTELTSERPNVAAGATRMNIVWQDRFGEGGNDLSVYHSPGTLIAANQPCEGTVQINANAPETNNPAVTLTFTSPNCQQVGFAKVGFDGPPAADAPFQAVTNNTLAVTLPAGTACSRSVQVQLFRTQTSPVGPIASDSINLDTRVDAEVTLSNPNLASLPGASGLQDVLSQGGASHGDPNYTRTAQARVTVRPGPQDCGTLKELQVLDASGRAMMTVPIRNNFYSNSITLPSLTPGAQTVRIVVSDVLGNTPQQLDRTIIYDPLRPNGELGPPDGGPVLQSNAVVNVPTPANALLQQLSFSNVVVNDNFFGTIPNFPQFAAGNRFWGVWLANSTQVITNPLDINNAAARALQWTALEVPTGARTIGTNGVSFNLNWSVGSGLPDLLTNTQARTIYVYAVFLDGAGNPSFTTQAGNQATLSQFRTVTVNLTPGYTVPKQSLPIVSR
jgi:hypothetical protein